MKPHRKTMATLLAVLLATALSPAVKAAVSKPNFVFILTDDQTLEQMRVMTHTRSLIGDAGATFTNAFISFPLCCPSRATFLTGLYAHNHLVLDNTLPTGGYYRFNGKNTLPVWLRAAGYHTIHVGKYLNSYGELGPRAIPPGYDEWMATVDPSTYQYYGYTMNENGRLKTYGTPGVADPATYQTDVLRNKAVDAIHRNARAGKPFYMNVWFLAPHREVAADGTQTPPRPAPRHEGTFANEPLPKPPSFNEANMSDKPLFMRIKPRLDAAAIATITTQYRAELESLLAVDEAVQAIVGALQTDGILDNTYVVFESDNGYFHGEHRTPDEKILGYEPSIRVPFMMRGPGIVPGTVVRERVVNADYAPTIVALSGAKPGLSMDGRSLLPYVNDPSLRTKRPVLIEAFFPVGSTAGFVTDRLPLALPVTAPFGQGDAAGSSPIPLGKAVMSYEGLRTDRYAFIEYTTGEHELYDLKYDPYELQSVHADPRYARTEASLEANLLVLRFCKGDTCRHQIVPVLDPN